MHAILLGSGLGAFEEAFHIRERIPYKAFLPKPIPAVDGHKRELLLAESKGTPFLILSGKFHFYEGLHAVDLFAPLSFAHQKFHLDSVILTASSGAFHPALQVGNWVYINHILAMQPIRLKTPNSSVVKDHSARPKTSKKSQAFQSLPQSIYAFQSGPSLGTRASYKMLDKLGAGLVGMSLYPESRWLNQQGIEWQALSLPVVNYHPIEHGTEPGHEAVIRIADQGARKLSKLFENHLSQKA